MTINKRALPKFSREIPETCAAATNSGKASTTKKSVCPMVNTVRPTTAPRRAKPCPMMACGEAWAISSPNHEEDSGEGHEVMQRRGQRGFGKEIAGRSLA